MGFQRVFLTFIFFSSIFLLWESWQHPNRLEPQVNSSIPSETQRTPRTAEPAVLRKEGVPTATEAGRVVKVNTGTLYVEINTAGASIERAELLRHKDAADKTKPVVLLQKGEHPYLVQAGLLGDGLPNHKTLFKADRDEYLFSENQSTLSVSFVATTTNTKVTKTYIFNKDSYRVDVAYQIENNGKTPILTSAYFQFIRDGSSPPGDTKLVPTYTGPAIYTDQEKFQKVDFSSIEKNKSGLPKKTDNGWIGILQHYFVAAWLPDNNTEREYFAEKLENGLFSTGFITPVPEIMPGKQAKISSGLYLGPASSKLDEIAPGLGLTVDYGWLTVVATPLFWMLLKIQEIVQNWGVAIILLTVMIKLFFFPLSAASYRSMAKMRLVAPKLEKLKKQHEGDREQLNRAMMDLYKTEKINPLGGCLPILIQIPVFIALYWAILSSVELRHAVFWGWITDLSAPDPYYVLPTIMGISMFIQSKLNPAPPDPLQAKLMQLMPVIFSVVFFFFPAGLVLYSVVNNILSIGQQWYITKKA